MPCPNPPGQSRSGHLTHTAGSVFSWAFPWGCFASSASAILVPENQPLQVLPNGFLLVSRSGFQCPTTLVPHTGTPFLHPESKCNLITQLTSLPGYPEWNRPGSLSCISPSLFFCGSLQSLRSSQLYLIFKTRVEPRVLASPHGEWWEGESQSWNSRSLMSSLLD